MNPRKIGLVQWFRLFLTPCIALFVRIQIPRSVDTRISDDGHSIRRRRECPKCSKRFTTLETTMLLVVKRSGNVEQFDRNKVISGVRKACQGRPIKEDDLKALGQQVEEDLRARGLAQVKSDEVGRAILKPLRDLDEVAYMRFASVLPEF